MHTVFYPTNFQSAYFKKLEKRIKRIFSLILLAVLIQISISGCAQENLMLNIETELGVMRVEIYSERVPITAANFMVYVDEGVFTDALFYRVVRDDNQPDNDVKIDVIQGGLYNDKMIHPPIAHETTEITGVLHEDGVISMARNEPGTATTEFFICVGAQPELDYGGKRNPDGQGFSAFGRVIEGLDILRLIHSQPAEEQLLEPAIRILGISRAE